MARDSHSARLECSSWVRSCFSLDRSFIEPHGPTKHCGTDKIEYLDASHPAQENVIGGAGTYAALGARLAAGACNSHLVSWIVDVGSDFPPSFRQLIDSWSTNCIFRINEGRLTTTAWNGYGPNEYRAFKYLTPKIRLEETDLSDEQVLAGSFHMVCSPARCMKLVNGVRNRRRDLLRKRGRSFDLADREEAPVFVWEPVPDLCTPEELARLREAASHVDVVSPNAEEFASFFTEMPDFQKTGSQVRWLLGDGTSLNGDRNGALETVLVIREGAHGCTTYMSRNLKGVHLRAFHQSKAKVVDPTGGGNTFLGALAIGLTGTTTPREDVLDDLGIPSDQRRLLNALVHATVAAGYGIEQVGMPNVSNEVADCWNGESYPGRVVSFLKREREYLTSQFSNRKTCP